MHILYIYQKILYTVKPDLPNDHNITAKINLIEYMRNIFEKNKI